MMRKENQSLWQVRHLWTTLCGDQTWAPCEMMLGPNDVELFTEDHVARHLLSLSNAATPASKPLPTLNGDAAIAEAAATVSQPDAADGDVSMANAAETTLENGETGSNKEPTSRKRPLPDGPKLEPDDTPMQNGDAPSKPNADAPTTEDAENDVTRIEARTAEESTALEDPESTFVHPMFITPDHARPDRDAGLADQEAEHLRKLLALYVQKQEEVCRGAHKLHEGLLKAQRLRANVLHWSKAEAHSGPNRDMSDGEDWYDREEWGLEEDLKKGQDEEEEDTTTTGKKTTRARR